MASIENIFNDDDFFGDIVDTPKEGSEQHKKRDYWGIDGHMKR